MSFTRISALLASMLALASCTSWSGDGSGLLGQLDASTASVMQVNGVSIPSPPENSDHGYLVQDDRIPTIDTCEGWAEFWEASGPAASFAIAENYPKFKGLEVSTEIYLKNQHLDPDKNGILCYEDPPEPLVIPLPPENSSHGYALEDDRIPVIRSCEKWAEFWSGRGPAVSFAVAEKYPDLDFLEVSTEIYRKNRHLDPDKNGILCHEDPRPVGPYEELKITDVGMLSALGECELRRPAISGGYSDIGFPLSELTLPTTGNPKLDIAFVDFLDVAGQSNEISEISREFETFEQFISLASYGQLEPQIRVHPQRILVPVDSGLFGMDVYGGYNDYSYFETALEAADPFIDFSDTDAFVIIPPKAVKKIVYGPISISGPGQGPMTDEGRVQAGISGGADMFVDNNVWIWLAHEFGHGIGLPHIYSSSETATIFDVMYWGQNSADFIVWNKWRLGWLDAAKQVRCVNPSTIDSKTTSHRLTPISSSDSGAKGVIVPLTTTQAVVTELRTKQEIDRFSGWQEGLFVYLLDTYSDSGKGGDNAAGQAVTALVKDEKYRDGWVSTLTSGETVELEGLTINVAGCDDERCDFEIVLD